jgi:surfeit locus 1 family protein
LTPFRLRVFVAIAVLAAAVFVRLGIWQLHRREERRAWNALVRSRLDSSEVDIGAIPRDTGRARFRRVRLSGSPDYDRELVLANGRNPNPGSPGVNLITPIRLAGTDTAIIVNRGWVYSPDAATVDLSRWHDRDSSFTGYVDVLPATGGMVFTNRPRAISGLSRATLATALPYPVAGLYVVALDDSAPAVDRPARLGVPSLGDGPHLSYAIQWFGFAVVALAGAAVVLAKSRGT